MNVAKNAMQNGILGRTAVGIWCQKPQIAPQMFPFLIFTLFPTVCVHFFPALIFGFYMGPARYFETCQSVNPSTEYTFAGHGFKLYLYLFQAFMILLIYFLNKSLILLLYLRF